MYLVGLKLHFHELFLLVKLTEVTSTQGPVYIKISFQIPGFDVTSVNFNSKKVYELLLKIKLN